MFSALHILGIGAQAKTRADHVVGQNAHNMTDWHALLRWHLLHERQYDINSPPISNRSRYADPNKVPFSYAAQTSDAGTDVWLQLRVLKLDQIDIADGPG